MGKVSKLIGLVHIVNAGRVYSGPANMHNMHVDFDYLLWELNSSVMISRTFSILISEKQRMS